MVGMLNRMLLRDLRSMGTQVITIALVIGCGIAAFVGSLSTYQSIRQSRDDFYQVARFADVFGSVKRAPDRMTSRIETLPDVAQVQTNLQFVAQVDITGVRQPLSGAVIGVDHINPAGRLNTVSLRRGTWPARNSNHVLVHETIARARNVRVGDTIRVLLNGSLQELVVSGIALSPEYLFAAAAFGSMDETSFGVFWVDKERLAATLDMQGAFNRVSVKVRPGGSVPAVIDQLDRLLKPYGATGFYQRSEQPSEKVVASEINGQRVFGLVLPSVFLAVAVFIMNVVISRQVSTQRDNIAALKALGYTDFAIVGYYLKLATLIVVLGLLVGLAVGKWYGAFMTGLYADVFRFPSFSHQIAPWVWLVPFAINLVAAFASTLLATRSILSLSPAQAMRPPSPVAYRASWLEKTGLAKRLPPALNMTIRHLERHPGRSTLAVVGVAGAISILVSGTWWRDALDYVLQTQFDVINRADIHLSFAEPVSEQARLELARLPGVYEVATQQSEAVRLHAGHRSELTAMQGIRPAGRLRQLIDSGGNKVALPDNGVVLGQLLARRLQVGRGDQVWVEFLNRRTPDRWMTVSSTMNEMMASGIYVRDDVLNAISSDRNTVSWAGLMIDSSRLDALYKTIKETPRVAGIAVKAEIIRHIEENTAYNILVFTTVLTVFAGLIAIGVTYNTARISLAERAWELATLRVLGMTEREVWQLLLGDLAVGLLLGIPLGWLIGTGLAEYLRAATQHDDFAIPLVINASTYAYAAITMLIAASATMLTFHRRLNQLDLIAVLKTRE